MTLLSLYRQYLEAPQNLSEDWKAFFSQKLEPEAKAYLDSLMAQKPKESPSRSSLKEAYRMYGHYGASLDPLGIQGPLGHPSLTPDHPVDAEHLQDLKALYCDKVGYEFMHLDAMEERQWFIDKVEKKAPFSYDKKEILKDLSWAEAFEKFIHVKFPAAKRFGLDGGESLIPGLRASIKKAAHLGYDEILMGMAHRGRLNVLTQILEKTPRAIFSEFKGIAPIPPELQAMSDVKYHLGASLDKTLDGHKIHLSLAPNPSHLEAVNPIVLGKTKAALGTHPSLAILMHGDASFAGQGMISECFNFSRIPGYETGGTLHIIINNQIGFTTNPTESRSTPYTSDVAKGFQVPVLHVNGDAVEDVVHVMGLALEFLHTFKKDVVVDLVCYRRYGHNESDEPAFTQPLMYKAIQSQPSTRALYERALVENKEISSSEADSLFKQAQDFYQKDFEKAESYKPSKGDWLDGQWKDFSPHFPAQEPMTGVSEKALKEIGKTLTSLPKGFNLHSKLQRFNEARVQSLTSGIGVDWAFAEALAFGSLLKENFGIRLSGQDVKRGTFTHRHAVFFDTETGKSFMPLETLSKNIQIYNSPLSEESILGFELGYTLKNPQTLVLWEAQFGDFANGAQMIFDQFISSQETKWLRLSGLVVLLPHGQEGQGPEHSSARLERYLQLCAENNMQVANCSTPANYFHILRRQMVSPTRKPLILMTPKSLLRHKLAVSTLTELAEGSHFQPVLQDPTPPKKVRRVLLCSGKVFYDLWAYRQEKAIEDVAIVRLEQFYPFPKKALQEALKVYGNAEVWWVQEESKNYGAWTFLDRRLEETTGKRSVYVGREETSSPAVGFLNRHTREQEKLLTEAFAR